MERLYLIAYIAGRAVAIDSDQVESVVDIGEVTPVPGSARHVRGLAALRSRVVTVIDTEAALGLELCSLNARRAVITLIDGNHYALLVEGLEDVAPFELKPLASGVALDHGWTGTARGIVNRDGEPILVIDLTALIPGMVQGFAVAAE